MLIDFKDQQFLRVTCNEKVYGLHVKVTARSVLNLLQYNFNLILEELNLNSKQLN